MRLLVVLTMVTKTHLWDLWDRCTNTTYIDLTQYPVFPWVLADYKSNEVRHVYVGMGNMGTDDSYDAA